MGVIGGSNVNVFKCPPPRDDAPAAFMPAKEMARERERDGERERPAEFIPAAETHTDRQTDTHRHTTPAKVHNEKQKKEGSSIIEASPIGPEPNGEMTQAQVV